MATVMLPTVRSEVDKRWISQKIGMIGAPGIGKSSFFQFSNALYIQCEPGLNHLSVYKLPCRSWDEFTAIRTALIQAKQKGELPYDTVIIDTIDEFVKLADEEILDRIRKKFKDKEVNSLFDYPGSSDKGNPAWGWRRDLVQNAISSLCDLGVAVVYLGHLDHREIKTPSATFHKQTISIGGALGTDLVSWCDHFLTIQSQKVGNETRRAIRTITDNTLDAKSRGNLVPDNFPIGTDLKDNWERFRKLFN